LSVDYVTESNTRIKFGRSPSTNKLLGKCVKYVLEISCQSVKGILLFDESNFNVSHIKQTLHWHLLNMHLITYLIVMWFPLR